MRRNRSRTMGFGLLSWLCTLVPVLNLISMQASVAGGVKFWLEAEGAMQAGTQAGTTH
jgi:CysZ protein